MTDPEDKPGLDLLNAYLRPYTQDEIDRDRKDFVDAIRNRHRGETLFCLGTGPSLATVDHDLLRHHVTLGCNGIGHVYQPDYYVIGDPFIYGLHKDVFHACLGTRILSTFTRGTCDLRIYWKYENMVGLKRDEIFSADSTGFILLSMAYVMGASRIVLVGYDGYPPGRGRYHAYDEHAVEVDRVRYEWREDAKERLMREAFAYAASAAPQDGCDIRLLTPSHLLGDLFDRIAPEDLR